MKTIYTYFSVLCALIYSSNIKAQVPDTVSFYLNDQEEFFFIQEDVFCFVMDSGQAYTDSLSTDFVDSSIFIPNDANIVLFDTAATWAEIDSIKDIIKAHPRYWGEYEVISNSLASYPARQFVRTRNYLEVQFDDPMKPKVEIDSFMSKFNLELVWERPAGLSWDFNYPYTFKTLGTELVNFESAIDKALEVYENSDDVALVHPDYTAGLPHSAPNDTLYYQQWGINNTGEMTDCYGDTAYADADANIDHAWNRGNQFGYGVGYTGNGVEVGVIDVDNFNGTHPDLSGQFIEGYDAINNMPLPINSNPMTMATGNHGTYMSSVIVAKADNNIGTVGVAYDAKVSPVFVALSNSYVKQALAFCFREDLDVVNMSFGWFSSKTLSEGSSSYKVLKQCYEDGREGKGTVLIASMGNDDTNAYVFPACTPFVLGVGASTPHDSVKQKFDDFAVSNIFYYEWGSNNHSSIDVVAPGVCIWGADYIGGYGKEISSDYYRGNGTSPATAMVSGIAALLLEKNSNFDKEQVYWAIKNGTDQIGGYNYSSDPNRPGWSAEAGYGRVNAYKILHQTQTSDVSDMAVASVPFNVVNPFSEQVKVFWPIAGTYSLALYDIHGRLLFTKTVTADEAESMNLSTPQLSPGVYVLKVLDKASGSIGVRELIKQ